MDMERILPFDGIGGEFVGRKRRDDVVMYGYWLG
jgi:hypothetical protein